ncbi:MAG: hypothetical protein A4E73_00501 [Syntrophaceae bacterium PtaU1.Bin231]|nr:MAG: hypothetical protein A4E73_00501 [Syntrophaceae bacterium PtaU1.Bin231]
MVENPSVLSPKSWQMYLKKSRVPSFGLKRWAIRVWLSRRDRSICTSVVFPVPTSPVMTVKPLDSFRA